MKIVAVVVAVLVFAWFAGRRLTRFFRERERAWLIKLAQDAGCHALALRGNVAYFIYQSNNIYERHDVWTHVHDLIWAHPWRGLGVMHQVVEQLPTGSHVIWTRIEFAERTKPFVTEVTNEPRTF